MDFLLKATFGLCPISFFSFLHQILLTISVWKISQTFTIFVGTYRIRTYTRGHVVAHTSYSLLKINTLDGLSSQIWEGQVRDVFYKTITEATLKKFQSNGFSGETVKLCLDFFDSFSRNSIWLDFLKLAQL